MKGLSSSLDTGFMGTHSNRDGTGHCSDVSPEESGKWSRLEWKLERTINYSEQVLSIILNAFSQTDGI